VASFVGGNLLRLPAQAIEVAAASDPCWALAHGRKKRDEQTTAHIHVHADRAPLRSSLPHSLHGVFSWFFTRLVVSCPWVPVFLHYYKILQRFLRSVQLLCCNVVKGFEFTSIIYFSQTPICISFITACMENMLNEEGNTGEPLRSTTP
jgi:hypothetical protein